MARKTLKEATAIIKSLVLQFGAEHSIPGIGPVISTMNLSALEEAFEFLGWPDMMPMPEMKCGVPNCFEWATCGTPCRDGYLRCCEKHFSEYSGRKRRLPKT